MRIFLIIMACLIGTQALAFERVVVVPISELEDLVIKSSSGEVKLNNFGIGEDSAFMADGLNNLEASLTARNKGTRSAHFSVMMSGLGSDGATIWAISMEPVMSTLTQTSTEVVKASTYIKPGMTRKTDKVWVSVSGDF